MITMPPFSGDHTPIISLLNFSEYPSAADDIRGENENSFE